MKHLALLITLLATFIFSSVQAYAQELEVIGIARDGQLGFQESASTVKDKIYEFHHLLLWIIGGITLFVLGLLMWVVIRYNDKVNPIPATFTHNKFWERTWTLVPVLILIVIAIPSFRLMYYQGQTPEPDITIKATGYQWYWGYDYLDEDISFLSYMIPEDEVDVSAGQVRLLSVDNPVVVPVNKNIQILTTAADVIHAIAIPSFGVKKDAIPGRINETWFKATRTGIFYGQCSEICGTGHAYMPIEIRVVTQEEYEAWLEEAKVEFGSIDTQDNIKIAQY